MSDCQMLHETVVRDIVDIITDVKDASKVEWANKKYNTGSIAKRASNLVLVFPVLVSTSLSIQTAQIISKAIERKCVSLLQILFSSIQLTYADNMYDYLKQFHTNIDKNMTLDDFMNTMDAMVNENMITVTDKEAYDAIKEDMHNINFHLSTELNPTSINNYKVRRNMYGEAGVVKEADSDSMDTHSGLGGFLQDNRNVAKKVANDAVNSQITKATQKNTKDSVEFFNHQLLPNDIQKANELMPTTMLVDFTTVNDKNEKVSTTTGVVGVKAKMYPIDATDIVNHVASKFKDSNTLFNLVRASTREISFFKDLAFAIDKAKMDAINMSRDSGNARMFKVLERRASKNRFTSLMKKNDASPITSLVMSQEEVEYLKKYNSLDMEKPYVAKTILENYNLMDIVLADESLEVAKFLYDDGDGTFETLTFDSLEKEAKDSSYKKVINLMSKVSR